MDLLRRLTIVSCLFIVAGCSEIADSHTVAVPKVQATDQVFTGLATELQREHQAGTFAGQVLIAQGRTVVFKHAYGDAERENRVKNTAAAISDMGSIAKTFTAAAVLQLAANGKLQLTDTIGKFYPNAPAPKKPITLEQLLAHSSGLDNFHNDSDFETMDKAEAERRILAMPLIAKPGEKIAYSNAAYTLLAAIVERTAGQPFQQYVQENLLKPLQLTDTGFYQDSHIAISNLARGYGGNDQGSTTYEKGLTWALIGAGGMVTSIDDLASWFFALQAGAIFPANTPNPVFTKANDKWLFGSFSQLDINGESIIQMGGSTDFGYTALIQAAPNRDLLIVLLLNAHDGKYANATHHRLSRNHILPIILRENQTQGHPGKLKL